MYEIIEVDSYKKIPKNSRWFGRCECPDDGIKMFEKSHPDLKIVQVLFNKAKKEVYVAWEVKIEQ